MNTNFNKIFLIVIVVLAIGLGLVWFFAKPSSAPQQVVDPNVQMRDLLQGRTTEVILGKIVEIEDSKFILDVPQVLEVGVSEGATLRMRIIGVSSDTKITARSQKDEATLAEELRKYRPDAGTPPPSQYSERTIKLSDLQVGDSVFVRGAVGADISQTKEIVATSIVRSQ